MFVYYGTKVTRRRLGFVADYCFICRKIQRCELLGVSRRSQVYNVAMGAGQLLGHCTRCMECDTVAAVDVNIFRSTSGSLSELEELTAETQPDIYDRYEPEFTAQNVVQVDPEVRRQSINVPFSILAHLVEERCGATHFDRQSALMIVAMILGILVILLAAKWGRDVGEGPRELPWAFIGYTYLAAGGAFFGLLATEPRRFIRRRIIPRLAKSLAQLDPSPAELDEALARAHSIGARIGRMVSRRRLEDAIGEARRALEGANDGGTQTKPPKRVVE